MKRIILIIAFIAIAISGYSQIGTGWSQMRAKVNFKDTINVDKAIMVHDTTITPGAIHINRLLGVTGLIQPQIDGKQDNPVNYAPTAINFGNTTQEYDITGTTWVASSDGTPNAVGHLLPATLTAIGTAYDDTYLSVRENTGAASATNPLTIQFTFSTVATFNVIKFRTWYNGSASHQLTFELWNGVDWDSFITESNENAFQVHTAEVLVPATHIIAGTVLGRFRHEQTGNAAHYLMIDFIVIGSGGGEGGASVQTAFQTPSTATGTVAATNVQDAIAELDGDLLKWDGGATGLTAATGRTSLGGTTVGQALFTLTNPSAIRVPLINADNTVTATSTTGTGGIVLSDSPDFTTDISTPAINLDGVAITASGPELNNTDGTTSNIQDQLDNTLDIYTSVLDVYATTADVNTAIATVNGYSASKLQFIVDTTANAPVAGDSILTHPSFISKHIEVYRGTEGGNMGKQYRNPSAAPQIYHNGYRFNSQTGTAIFKPVFATNDHVVIEATDSTSWTDLVPQAAPGFAQIESGTVQGSDNTNGTSFLLTLPTGVEVGNLIAVCLSNDGDETLTIDEAYSGTGWTIEAQAIQGTTGNGLVAWKVAEAINSLRFLTDGSSEMCSWIAYRISGFSTANPMTVTNAGASSTNFDPPSNTGEYGAKNYLWMAFAASDNDVVASVAPSDFSGLLTQAGAAVGGSSVSVATREYNTAAAYNPGTFTSTTIPWMAFTVIINPIP